MSNTITHAVFRVMKPVGGISGSMFSASMMQRFNRGRIVAILPYYPLPSGFKVGGQVAMHDGSEEASVTDYDQIIKTTEPIDKALRDGLVDQQQYDDLLDALNSVEHFGTIEIIKATQINHVKRKMEHREPMVPRDSSRTVEDDVEIVREDIEITVDIVNDDVESTADFQEEWA